MFFTEKGFTRIDLAITVVVIVILTAIAIPNYLSMENRRNEYQTRANMHALHRAATDYCIMFERYTTDPDLIVMYVPYRLLPLKNAFSGKPQKVFECATPSPSEEGWSPGDIVIYVPKGMEPGEGFAIRGADRKGRLTLILTSS